jgi:hypothetical protein
LVSFIHPPPSQEKPTFLHPLPHPHTYCPLCIAASFLIPLYVDISRCFRSCSHHQSCFIWYPQPLLSLSLSPFSSQPPHFQQLSIHILLSLACPVVGFRILVNLHQPLFLFLLPRIPCSNSTFTNVFQVGEGPPSCVFSFMC